MKKILLLIVPLVTSLSIRAQSYSPTTYEEIIITESHGVSHSDYVALVNVNTAAKISAGDMQTSGNDIRFHDAADNCFGNPFDHFVESGMNTSNTLIWVRIPQLSANAVDTIRMYYGDPAAVSNSNFNATFPNAIINPGTTTLGGVQDVGWLELGPNDVLTVTKDSVLDIRAARVIINGTINGEGKGNGTSTVGVATGLGTGGGNAGTTSGAGGGGYGGPGGNGGYDSSDPINQGGIAYGTQTGTDIDKGSAGGNCSSVYGGAGGGALIIRAMSVSISGTINMDGADGQQPGGGQGGGGGSGGGVLIEADSLDFTGTINANGGDGSVGTSTANDDGGGGGGGRIKFFTDANLVNSGSLSVAAGAGGPNGGFPAADGNAGTTFTSGAFTFTPATTGGTGAPPTSTVDTSYITPSACITYNAPDGQNYNQSGQYFAQLINTSGCDSVVSIDLTINQPSAETVSVSTCDSYTAPNGVTWSQSGQYFVIIPNSAGCDSTITLNLTINNSSSTSITETACASYTAPDGQTYTSSGQYTANLSTSAGCDSTVNIDLTILVGDTTSLIDSVCNAYTAPDGSIFNTTGIYTVAVPDTNGCDSTIVIDLTVNEANASVTPDFFANTITADNPGTYQWIDCETNSPIEGETGAVFQVLVGGKYALVITNGNCTDTSACVNFIGLAASERGFREVLKIAPNPTRGNVTISGLAEGSSSEVAVIDVSGKLIQSFTFSGTSLANFDVNGIPGMYFIRVVTETDVYIVKLLKQ